MWTPPVKTHSSWSTVSLSLFFLFLTPLFLFLTFFLSLSLALSLSPSVSSSRSFLSQFFWIFMVLTSIQMNNLQFYYFQPQAVGPTCAQCRPGSYHLSEKSPQGCLKCFCFGVTDQCRSSNWYRTTVSYFDSFGLNQNLLLNLIKRRWLLTEWITAPGA